MLAPRPWQCGVSPRAQPAYHKVSDGNSRPLRGGGRGWQEHSRRRGRERQPVGGARAGELVRRPSGRAGTSNAFATAQRIAFEAAFCYCSRWGRRTPHSRQGRIFFATPEFQIPPGLHVTWVWPRCASAKAALISRRDGVLSGQLPGSPPRVWLSSAMRRDCKPISMAPCGRNDGLPSAHGQAPVTLRDNRDPVDTYVRPQR